MDFIGRNNIHFEISEDEETFEFVFTDEDSSEEVGTLSIEKNKAQALASALGTLFRERYGVFEENLSHTSRLSQQEASGTIRFRENS